MAALEKPILMVRVNAEARERVIKLLRDNVKGITLAAQWPHKRPERQRGELTLFFAASEAALASIKVAEPPRPQSSDDRSEWNCSHCTYLNSNPLGLICEVCDSPRNVLEWSGFKRQNPEAARTRVAVAYAVCAKAVNVLATCGVADRTFESGGVQIMTHAAQSWTVLFQRFSKDVHGSEVPPKVGIRIRGKSALRDRLLKEHMETCKGSTPGCRLNPDPESYTHVFNVFEVEPQTAKDLGVPLTKNVPNAVHGDAVGGAPGPVRPEFYLFSQVSRKNDYSSQAPNNLPVPPIARVCRAFYKIEELATASHLVGDVLTEAAALPGGGCALDVGAAPGGWTAFLAEHFGCVLAVDPAELDEEVAKLQTVKHIKCLLQSSDAAQGGTSDAYASIREACTSGNLPTLVCCDINQAPTEAIKICLRALPVVAPGCVFVITMKLLRRSSPANADVVREAKELLATVCDPQTIEEHWLFANTYHERTIVGRLGSVPSQAEASVDLLRVVETRQRGLHMILNEIPDPIEAIKILRLCHSAGVTVVHLVPGSLGDDVDALSAVERAGEQMLVRVVRHQSLDACIKSFPADSLIRVVALNDDGVPEGCGCAAVAPTLLHSVDMIGQQGIGPELYVFLCAHDTAVVMEEIPSAVRVVVPTSGLQQFTTPAVVAGNVLWEIRRQRALSGTDYSLTEAEKKSETEFLTALAGASSKGT